MLITYGRTNVDERADDWKSMLPVLIQHARRDLQHGGSKKSALAVVCFSFVRGKLDSDTQNFFGIGKTVQKRIVDMNPAHVCSAKLFRGNGVGSAAHYFAGGGAWGTA
jgi:hypothetical protein